MTFSWKLKLLMIVVFSVSSLFIFLKRQKRDPYRTLLIDDLRTLNVTKTARTYNAGIRALKRGPWDVLFLDHDFGDQDPRKTGYGIICWLEENTQYLPKKIILVSMNPVGRKQMQVVINRLYQKQ